jgi:hypothetical protein
MRIQEPLVDIHKKSIETMAESNQKIIDAMHSMGKLHYDYMCQMAEHTGNCYKEILANPSSISKMTHDNGPAKEMLSKTTEHTKNMADVVSKTNSEIFSMGKQTLSETFDMLKQFDPRYRN